MAKPTVGEPRARPADLTREIAELRRRCDDLEDTAERLQDLLAALEITVVDGYFVKLWPDLDSGRWVAHCPTVRCASESDTRDEAAASIRSAIAQMTASLASLGQTPPARDV